MAECSGGALGRFAPCMEGLSCNESLRPVYISKVIGHCISWSGIRTRQTRWAQPSGIERSAEGPCRSNFKFADCSEANYYSAVTGAEMALLARLC